MPPRQSPRHKYDLTMKPYRSTYLPNGKYYLLIVVAGIIAFLPVSFMLFSLKNDIVALDFPIKYFISQCLHNRVEPFWFNTWSKGFPLESIITWSFFSPLQFLSGTIFEYNLYVLHAEFIFYILLAGAGMFSFLKAHVSPDKDFCVLMAISYMLSGFTVGSSQWMTYITALALLPVVVHCFLHFLKNPSIKTSVLLVAVYYLMLTSVYPAFTIITSYAIAAFFLAFLFYKSKKDSLYFSRTKIWTYIGFTFVLIILTYSTSLYFSLQVLNSIDRGNPIAAGTGFFHSNYLHPKALTSLLLPFSSTKIQIANTEGTMMDSYAGLLPVVLLPLSVLQNVRERNTRSFLLFLVASSFLIVSFGHLTPVREFLNVLPGFSYFRNPGLFRLFFLFFLFVYLTYSFRSFNLATLLQKNSHGTFCLTTILLLGSIFLLTVLANLNPVINLVQHALSVREVFNGLTYEHTLAISAGIQLFFLLILFAALKRRNHRLLQLAAISDLVVNCLICTPFFTVSSYTVKETNNTIFKSTPGFPVQTLAPQKVATNLRRGEAIWHNTNVYKKQVSALDSYVGPLNLNTVSPSDLQANTSSASNKFIIPLDQQATLNLLVQQPNHVVASVTAEKPTDIVLQQNYYAAWHAYWNGNKIGITPLNGAMKVTIPKGGKLEFRYERTTLFFALIILNSLVIGVLLYFMVAKLLRHPFKQQKRRHTPQDLSNAEAI